MYFEALLSQLVFLNIKNFSETIYLYYIVLQLL